jgi:methyltransferase (TIGR00027 family)
MKDNSSKTAWGPTVQLAIEQLFAKKDRLIIDNIAFPLLPLYIKLPIYLLKAKLIRNAIFKILDKKVPGVRGGLICRKRYIDEKIIESIKNNETDSVVILGSGFDTCAYRNNELSSLPVFELDFPQNIAEKKIY